MDIAALAGGASVGVEGETAEERIQARRDRIAKRVAAEVNAEGAKAEADLLAAMSRSSIDPHPHASLAKITDSRHILAALKEGASQNVSLVRITADLAETQKRTEEEEHRLEARKRLEDDHAASQEDFQEILAKWGPAMAHGNAEALKDALDDQREETTRLISRKDDLIESFKEDLKKKDTTFVDELRSQSSDIQTILETMSEQAKVMWGSYEKQLEDIEVTFLEEREQLIKNTKETWTKHALNRVTTEEGQAAARLNAIADHEERMVHLRQTDHEEYLSVKAKLENDISVLEQQLEKMRATYQLNSEKLDYNYQVLKKRAEENGITISQQKRKISRMQDMLNNLRIKIMKQEKQFQDENAALTEDYKRITEQFKDLQKKFKHFQTLDHEQYQEVWAMNEDIAVGLLSEVLSADEVLMSQQMGLNWVPPDESVLSSNARRMAVAGPGRKAAEVMADVMEEPDETESVVGDLPSAVVKKALLLLASECEYLIESKLSRLLAPLEDKQRHLMKLDAVFKGLGIDTADELMALCQSLVRVGEEGDAIDSYELVHPNRVSDLVEVFVQEQRARVGLDQKFEAPDLNPVAFEPEFWQQLNTVHSDKHRRIWGVLDKGLDDYLQVLEGREQALDMTEQLRIQNGELKMLLQQYMAADVNRELVIPPTMVLT